MNRLTLLTLIFAFTFTVSFVIKKSISGDYEVSIEKATEEITNDSINNIIVDLEDLKGITANSDKYQLIDLRSKTDFEKGHLPNAINIPIDKVIKEKSFTGLDNEKQNILYSYDYSTSSNAVFYLKQTGVQNVKYLQADFVDAKSYIEGSNNNLKSLNKEIPKYNYNKFFNQAVKKSQPKMVIPKAKKVKQVSGGC